MSDYWHWLEDSFLINLRAQAWYNGDPPRFLAGHLNDKSNRLIGWPTIRQLRVSSHSCSDTRFNISHCNKDYSLFNEDRSTYLPGWLTETNTTVNSSLLARSFVYRSSDDLDGYMYIGDHATYAGGGYVYEIRGSLNQIRANLSILRELQWIDDQTRAIFIQLTLYNPNVQLFTAVTLLAECLSTGGVFTSARFEPIQIYGMSSSLMMTIDRLILLLLFCLPFSIHIVVTTDLYYHLHVVCCVLSH